MSSSAQSPADRDDWDAHWDKYAERARINPGQLMRFDWLAREVAATISVQRNPLLLDIGSGTGHLLELIHQRLPQLPCAGVEYSGEGVRAARALVPSARFEQADLLTPQPRALIGDRQATVATCSEVLEHVDDPALLMRNARVFLAPGAIVHVTVPGGPMSAFDHAIGHRRHFTPESLSATMAEAGYETISAGRIGFPFFNLYRYLIILSGSRVQSAAHTGPSALERAVSAVFGALMRLNIDAVPAGYQVVGTFRRP